MRDKPIDADELDKAKNQLAAGFVFGLQTVDGIAQALGARAVRRGRLEAVRRGRDALPGGDRRRRAAGGAQVPRRQQPHARDAGPARAAAASRPREPRSDGREADPSWLLLAGATRALRVGGARARAEAARQPPAPSTSSTRTPRPRARPSRGRSTGRGARISSARRRRPSRPSWRCRPVERFTLKNGLEVIVVPRKELPVVSFGIAVQAGGYDETRDTLGVSDFVAAMLRRGTKTRSADDISRAIDFVGGSLDAQATNEGTTARLLGAVEGRQAVPRPAVRHPAAPVVPRGRDGRGARPDAGRGRRALRQPARAGERALRQPAVRREAPRRLGADRRGRPQDHARAPGDVLEDVLPPEPRHPGRRGRRRRDASCAPRSRRRSAAGRAPPFRRGRPGRCPSSRGRASCSSTAPTRRRRRSCSATRGSSTPIRAGTRRR